MAAAVLLGLTVTDGAARAAETPPPLAITSGALPTAVVGVRYSFTLKRAGGAAGGSWGYVIGKLPPNVRTYANGNIRGIPTKPGTFRFTMRYTDGSRATAQKNFAILVKAGTLKAPIPTIGGSPVVGHTLRVVTGTWTGGTRLSFRWYANGTPLARATGTTLRVGAALRGKHLVVKVTGAKPGYITVTHSSRQTAKVIG